MNLGASSRAGNASSVIMASARACNHIPQKRDIRGNHLLDNDVRPCDVSQRMLF